MPMLLNWIWQGSALTAIVALLVCRRRAVNAATRERIWWATLAAVCLMPLVSMLGVTPTAGVAVTAAPLIVVARPSGVVTGAAWLIWVSWLTISVVRLVGALVALGRAKRSAASFPSERLGGLSAWTRVSREGRRATLVVSADVRTAAVLGLGRPLIAVSPAALARLTDEELDGILVHEYGHVQRRDDLGVLLQRGVRAVFGLHPAVWWLDRALTFEREVACDDLVLAQARSSPQRYARSLVKLVEQAGPGTGLRLAPGALFSRPQITRRIVRLLDRGRNASVRRSKAVLGFATAAIVCGALAALSVELVAIAAGTPLLASRSLASRLIVPFVSASVADTAGPQSRTRPLPTTDDPVDPVAGIPQDSGRTDTSAVAAIDTASPEALSAEPLDVLAVVTPVSAPTPHVSPDGATDSEPVTPVARAPPSAPAPTMALRRAVGAASAVGRGSREGAIRTAGFFTRIGKSVAGAF